jgi:hypothetical protein
MMGFDFDRSDVDQLPPPDDVSIPAAPGRLARVPAAEADHAVEFPHGIKTNSVHAARQRNE